MITLNSKEVNGQKRLLGSVAKQPFNIPYSKEAQDELLSFDERMEDAAEVKDYQEIVEEAMAYIKSLNIPNVIEVAGTDLFFDVEKAKYYLRVGDVLSTTPLPNVIAEKIQKAVDMDLDPSPWIKFWTRWMRNPRFSADKTEYMAAYISALFTDGEKLEAASKDGYSDEMAKEMATFDQISITKEGLLAAFKYVSLKDTTKSIEIDEKTGAQKIVEIKQSLLGKSTVSIDANDKVIKTPGVAYAAEELIFVPPVMGSGGRAFTCEPLADNKFKDFSGHVIRVGQRHRLETFNGMNCEDGSFGGDGLHVGGYYYVQGYGGKTKLLVDCLVDPAHIGGFSDMVSSDGGNYESAIRVKEYYVVGTHFAVNKSMYHPSAYAALLDTEWTAYKKKAIEDANKALDKLSN